MRAMIRSGLSAFLKKRVKPYCRKTVLSIPSKKRYIARVSSEIISGIKKYDLDEKTIFNVKLCVHEAVTNAMVHGNNLDYKRKVNVTYWVKDGSLNIIVKDEGEGFNERLISDPTEGSNILKNSGRGIYLIRNFMDIAEYNKRGNALKMVKRIF